MTTQTALQKTNDVSAIAKQNGYEESFVQTVKDTFAKGATDTELQLFLQTAKRTGLDPMARQIFCVKRWDSAAGGNVMSIQISIDGFRAIADRTGKYVPSREPTYTFVSNKLESATAYIKKFVAGAWHEIAATAFYDEYVQTTKDGKPNRMWQKMPRLMLAKTAESLVLRKAFPAELSGLYTVDEMGTSANGENHASTLPSNVQRDLEEAEFEAYHEEKGMSAPKRIFPPEAKALRQQLIDLCRQAGKSDKFTGLSLNKFDTLDSLNEMEDAVAKLRASIPKTDDTEEREKMIAVVGEYLASKSWKDGEYEQLAVEYKFDGGLVGMQTDDLRRFYTFVINEPEAIDAEEVN